MPAAQKHRDAIIDAAIRLFRKQGFAATGMNDIVRESGAPKGSVYYYFPTGKNEIAEAAIVKAGENVERTLRELGSTAKSGAELCRRFGRQFAEWMAASGFRDGCPITTVLLELAPADRKATRAGSAAYASRIGVFVERLERDGHPHQRARRLAILCISAVQGALIQARVDRSKDPIMTTVDELADLLGGAAA